MRESLSLKAVPPKPLAGVDEAVKHILEGNCVLFENIGSEQREQAGMTGLLSLLVVFNAAGILLLRKDKRSTRKEYALFIGRS
ncbi:hypothetical protein [Paenibacillus arenilitoris]|uniref:Uncharacterized protein n=1 Tax=Paenibacillus arenilitoris TaxID=2772299 RepID=A0A927H6P1_9BACL|nr:hypothetical protein [Paenibacillus arenilitoris]MBD2870200.1 hypothetical protein [Paenibacillus arenilitoris]